MAFVSGVQGDDPDHLKAAAAAKHFLVHSGPENVRHEFDAVPSKQDLLETYVPAFETLVTESRVEGVMAAYNAVYGEPMVANTHFLQTVLREEWQFDGYITSDCGAVSGAAERHKYRPTVAEAAAAALEAGTNLNCGQGYRHLGEAYEAGLVTEELIHERTVQLFKTRFKLYVYPFRDTGAGSLLSAGSLQLAPPSRCLYDFLEARGALVDLEGYDEACLNLTSGDALRRIQAGDPSWHSMLPEPVAALIKKRGLYGCR